MKFGDRKLSIIFILPCLIMILFSSCVSYSTLQTPETLEPGHVYFGAGATMMCDIERPLDAAFIPEIAVRVGLVEGVDIGLKYTHPYMFLFDSKYQLYKGPVNVAMDFGISLQPIVTILTYGIYPMIMIGQEHWYLGVKGTFGNFDVLGGEMLFEDPFYLGTTIVTGATIGSGHIKLLLELNTMFINGAEKPVFFPAGGVYVGF
jgi:hypothetical protein